MCEIIIWAIQRRAVGSLFRNAKCGKIQCQSTATKPIESNAVAIDTTVDIDQQKILCRGTHVYQQGQDKHNQNDTLDPGLVLPGTKCGENAVGFLVTLYRWVYRKTSSYIHISIHLDLFRRGMPQCVLPASRWMQCQMSWPWGKFILLISAESWRSFMHAWPLQSYFLFTSFCNHQVSFFLPHMVS